MRRILVMIAVGMLVLTALAALSAPVDEPGDDARPAPARPAEPPKTVTLRAPARGKSPVHRVRRGLRVVLEVRSSVAGQVEIGGLGLLQTVDPGAPATFDIVTTRPGRYDVTLLPATGARSRLGTIVVG
jgi:hypothetical protein